MAMNNMTTNNRTFFKLTVVSTGSNGNCYLLQSPDGKYIILDCGVPYGSIEKACHYNVSDIQFALVTHEHSDHASGVPQLLHVGIDVFTNHEVRDRYKSSKWLARNKAAMLCGWKVIPFVVPHTHANGDECLNYAYILEKYGTRFLYMSDFMFCRYNLSSYNINHFLIAVNYTELEDDNQGKISHVARGHSSLDTVKDFLRISMTDKCKSILACHLSNRNADAKKILTELTELAPNANVCIAKKGACYELM